MDSPWLSKILALDIRRTDEDARAYIRHVASSNALNLIRLAAQAAPDREHNP